MARRNNRSGNSRRFIPIQTQDGLKAQVPIEEIRRSANNVVCHGTTAAGNKVNSPAYNVTGKSTVIGNNANFDQALSLSNDDMEMVSTTWLRNRGFTITPPAAAQS